MDYLSRFVRLFRKDYSNVKQGERESLPRQETETIIFYTPRGYIEAGRKLMREQRMKQKGLDSSLDSN
ncbi:MAG: hypothetical protein Q7S56_01740 [Nanoarchaeota archaeon]|nr:hypothetical protein [Nanoarchaeota archaeon]